MKRGGGLCAYIKKSIDVHFIPDDIVNLSDENLELLHFRIIPKNQKILMYAWNINHQMVQSPNVLLT